MASVPSCCLLGDDVGRLLQVLVEGSKRPLESAVGAVKMVTMSIFISHGCLFLYDTGNSDYLLFPLSILIDML